MACCKEKESNLQKGGDYSPEFSHARKEKLLLKTRFLSLLTGISGEIRISSPACQRCQQQIAVGPNLLVHLYCTQEKGMQG